MQGLQRIQQLRNIAAIALQSLQLDALLERFRLLLLPLILGNKVLRKKTLMAGALSAANANNCFWLAICSSSGRHSDCVLCTLWFSVSNSLFCTARVPFRKFVHKTESFELCTLNQKCSAWIRCWQNIERDFESQWKIEESDYSKSIKRIFLIQRLRIRLLSTVDATEAPLNMLLSMPPKSPLKLNSK